MAVDTSVIGRQTGAWRVVLDHGAYVLDHSVLANFATAVGNRSAVYRGTDALRK